MRRLYFDTETNDMIKFKLDDGHQSQPHIVQLAARLFEDDDVVHELNVLIKPDGWVIPPELTEIHGISHDRALSLGYNESPISQYFYKMYRMADEIIAHNIDFDIRMMNITSTRHGFYHHKYNKKHSCTMKSTTSLCKLPQLRGRGGYKWPKLIELYKHLFGEEFDGAHNAMVDVDALVKCHQELLQLGIMK